MKFTNLILVILSLLMAGAVSAQQTKRPKKKVPAQMSGEKTTYEPDSEMLRDLQAKVRVVESRQEWKEFNRQSPAANPARTRTAYTAQFSIEATPENLMQVVIVHNAQTDKFYEIRGIGDFPWRPFSDFKWISNDVLQFDQWVNPNNGGRYQINLKTGKPVAAGYIRSN